MALDYIAVGHGTSTLIDGSPDPAYLWKFAPTTAGLAQWKAYDTYTLDEWSVYVNTATTTSALCTVYINSAADTTLQVSCSSAGARVQDATGSVTLAANDLVCAVHDPNGDMHGDRSEISEILVHITHSTADLFYTGVTAAAQYSPVTGSTGYSTAAQAYMKWYADSATLSNFRVVFQYSGDTLAQNVYINGSASSNLVCASTGGAEAVEDVSGSETLSTDDLWCYTGSAVSGGEIQWAQIDVTETANIPVQGSAQLQATSGTVSGAWHGTAITIGNFTRIGTITVSQYTCYCVQVRTGATNTATIYLNGGQSSNVTTSPSAASTRYEDLTGSETWDTASTYLQHQLTVTGGSSGNTIVTPQQLNIPYASYGVTTASFLIPWRSLRIWNAVR